MEILLEFLFELIFEGSIALGSEKKVPMPVRIIALLIVWTFFFGMGGILIYEAYQEYLAQNKSYMILGIIGALIVIGGIFIAYKMFKKKHEQENDTW